MGILIDVEGVHARRLRRWPSRAAVFATIRKTLEELTSDPLLEQMQRVAENAHTLEATLHPAAPPIELTWKPDGRLQASVKTSTVGPGFHAHVIDLLDALGSRLGLKWNWSASPDGADADETNYAVTRDFASLQLQMAHFTRGLAKSLVERADGDLQNIALNWPIAGPHPRCPAFTVTPMGPVSREQWQRVADASEDELLAIAADFYPWWNVEPDAGFYRKTAMGLLWAEVRWNAPATAEERDAAELAIDCAQRARELQPDVLLPDRELDELQQLLEADPESPITPAAEGLGFFRGDVSFTLSGGWSIVLPGYYHQQWDAEHGSSVFWHGGRTIRITSYSIGKPEDPMTPEAILGMLPKVGDTEPSPVEMPKPHLLARARVGQEQQEGRACHLVFAEIVTHHSLCVASIYLEDEVDTDWALQLVRSIDHPGPRDPAPQP